LSETPLFSIRDLAVNFTGAGVVTQALRGVSFDIPRGRTVALVGESGSGKSVTAQAMMGILPKAAAITGGSILFNDPGRPDAPLDLTRLDPSGKQMRALRGDSMTMIFQEPMSSLSPLHTVGDQVTEAYLLHNRVPPHVARDVAEAVFERVGLPDPARIFNTYPFELSGGMRQRAMIAMALICRPALLIADEPTTALDVTTQAQILELISDLQAETGMSVLLITHDLGVVANVADDVVVMYRGRIVESGDRETTFRNPQHPYLRALMNAAPHFDMKPGERLTPLREVADARLLAAQARPATKRPAGPVLEARDISKTFTLRSGWFSGQVRKVRAVSDVSLTLMPGKTLGLVGESGCGKTTVSRMIMRAITPDSGAIRYDDGDGPCDISTLKGDDLMRYRRAVQFIFQDPYGSLNPRMTVYQLLTEPMRIHKVGTEQEQFARASMLLAMVGLDRHALRRYPHSFSGGQRQRLGIARALALSPQVLLCDEPVSALDVSVQAQVLNLLKDLQQALDLSYIFVSHNLAVVDYMADDIAVMCRGHIVEQAPREVLFNAPLHPYTQALLAAVPAPDLDHPLDFAKLRSGRFSEPTQWPEPYRLAVGEAGAMREVAPQHYVRLGDAGRAAA